MTARSPASAEFQDAVAGSIARNGEAAVLFRLHAGAGTGSFEILGSLEAFNLRLSELPPRTGVIVFGDVQLSSRGTVDDGFVERALRSIADGTEWTLARLTRTVLGNQSWFHTCSGATLAELESALRDSEFWGEQVAFGAEPDWLEDSETVFSAVIPDPDGTARTGVY